MIYVMSSIHPSITLPDFAEGHYSFIATGGDEGLKSSAIRDAGWHGKALIPLSLISLACAIYFFGLAVSLAGIAAAASGMAISALAKNSSIKQGKAAKNFDAMEAAKRFLTTQLLNSWAQARTTVSDIQISSFLARVISLTLTALQRLFVALASLAHQCLSNRLLPAPAGLS